MQKMKHTKIKDDLGKIIAVMDAVQLLIFFLKVLYEAVLSRNESSVEYVTKRLKDMFTCYSCQ